MQLFDGATEQIWDGTTYIGSEVSHTLTIEQAAIGTQISENVYNSVEMEAVGYDGRVTAATIVSAHGTVTIPLKITLSDQKLTFRLVNCRGPVTLSGTHTVKTSTETGRLNNYT